MKNLNLNINVNDMMELIGNDFNPYNTPANIRIVNTMSMFVSNYKEMVHVLVQAKSEGMKPEELTAFINHDNLKFIESINAPGASAFDSSDFEMAEKLVTIIGEDFNPFNWDATTRIPLVIGHLVSDIKSLIHIVVQAGKEGLSMDELLSGLDPEMVEILNQIAA